MPVAGFVRSRLVVAFRSPVRVGARGGGPRASAPAPAASAERVPQGLQDRFVLLQAQPDFVGRDPTVRVKTFGRRFQLFAPLRIGHSPGNAGHHFRVARPESREALRPELRVRRAERLGRERFGGRRLRDGARLMLARFARRPPHLAVASWLRLRTRRGFVVSLEDLVPVEPDVRVMFLDQADGLLVERRAADAHAWRRAEPVQDAGAGARPAPGSMNDEGVFVAAFVASEPEDGQAYFPFCFWARPFWVRAAATATRLVLPFWAGALAGAVLRLAVG